MILKETFTKEHIEKIVLQNKCDPIIVERAIVSLGLVEAISKVGGDFVFKGGSSLMLLLNKLKRLSTDCDIIVAKEYDIDDLIKKASKLYPFKSVTESIRKTNNSISKKHYKFIYDSIYNQNGEVTILLDVLFEDNPYTDLISMEINNNLLICDNNPIFVNCPKIEAILGDKLTAFAPNTTGIKYHNVDFSNDKRLEVVKQYYDIVSLIGQAKDFEQIKKNYLSVVKNEIAYRGLNIDYIDVLKDTFNTSLTILSRGKIGNGNYENLLNGIKKLQNHILIGKYSAEIAALDAADVMLLSAGLITDIDILNIEITSQQLFTDSVYSKINYIKKLSELAFNKVAYAIRLICLKFI